MIKRLRFSPFRTVLGIVSLGLMVLSMGVAHGLTLTDTDSVSINAEVTNGGLVVPDVTNFLGNYNCTDITLNWEQTFTPVSSFELYYRSNPSAPMLGPVTINSADRTYTLPNAIQNVTYEFELITVSGSFQSPGVTTSVTTPSCTTPPTTTNPGGAGGTGGGTGPANTLLVPAPVITSISTTEELDRIRITWEQRDIPAFPIVEYRVFRAVNDGSFPITPYATVAGNVFEYTDTGVSLYNTYRYFVIAREQSGLLSGNSNVVQLTLVPTAPESTVKTLPAVTTTSVFPVPYVAYDRNGTSTIELYVRKDGGAFTLYETATFSPAVGGNIEGSITFDAKRVGGDGYYEFYTINTNNGGMREAIPTTPDAHIHVDTAAPAMPIADVRNESTNDDYIAALYITIPDDAEEMFIGTSGDSRSRNPEVGRWIPITGRVLVLYPEAGTKSISITYRDEVGLLSPTLFLRITFTDPYSEVVTPETPQTGEEDQEEGNYFDDIDRLPEQPSSIEEPRGTDDLTNAFYRDTDGDGVSDGDEVTYYNTDPESYTNFDFEDFFFTTNIQSNSTFLPGEGVVIYGLTLPNAEIDIYVINTQTGERTYIGTATSGDDGRYLYRMVMAEESGVYTMEFQVRPRSGGQYRIFERINLSIGSSLDLFFSHFFVNIQREFLYDLYTLEEFKKGSLQKKQDLLETYQNIEVIDVLTTARPRIGIQNFIPETSRSNLKDPITMHLVWRNMSNPSIWYAQKAYVLKNEEFIYVTPPRDLAEGSYELFVQGEDANGIHSFPRTLQFTIAGLTTHHVTNPTMDTLLQDCLKVLYRTPDFWLWLLVAFLLGVMTSYVIQRIMKKRDEQENEEEETNTTK